MVEDLAVLLIHCNQLFHNVWRNALEVEWSVIEYYMSSTTPHLRETSYSFCQPRKQNLCLHAF